ncbi:type II toxin-antitoxin system Phd/YefM family antitoxin [Rudanella lutea]|jgi:prevent-host-death family protein|uniref:type II toxin-antitoxin system Phd/YefM family antitoxin n=1 Tax=Rudanella lutea TaxID=451374 RepID=UPI00035D2B6C|nr:type II toxin-antitoxin system Phd/YefM family antitoxin [Rudanella lutea]
MTTFSAQEARQHFSEVINKAGFAKEPVIITRSGKNVVAVISYDDYEFFRQLEDKFDGELAMERINQKNKRYSLEEVEAQLGL